MKNKKEQRKLLPPFLMIRSGLLNDYILATAITSLAAWADFTYSEPKDMGAGTLFALILTFLFAAIKTYTKKTNMQSDIDSMLEQMNDFKEYNTDARLLGFITHPKLARRIVQYMSKKDRTFFDRIIQQPDSLHNPTMISDIVIGHLKSHPEDAEVALQKLKISFLLNNQSLYKKLLKKAK